MYGYRNEAGEPIMSGEAWRTEQALDMREPPYDPDDYLADNDDDEEDLDDEAACPVHGVGGCDSDCPDAQAYRQSWDQDKDPNDGDDEGPPPARYHCGVCDQAFPAGVTGHTDDNPCTG